MFCKKSINVGKVKVGGNAPVAIQTMTNTNTENVDDTLAQIESVVDIGCDLIRVSCPTRQSALALKEIVQNVKIPVIADIHFNYKRAIEAIEAGVHCVRINPGNISDDGIAEIVACAKNNGAAIRIGINSGSLDKKLLEKYKEPCPDAIIESALLNIRKLEELKFDQFKISVKSSDVKNTIKCYRKLAKLVDYPLHLGVTEAGPMFTGVIKSAIGIGSLLADGIGDTIRVSLSVKDIREEINAAKQILKSLNLYSSGINVVSCPTCSRTLIDVVGIADKIAKLTVDAQTKLTISILGCVVNGPGEAVTADIGIFGFRQGIAKIYAAGKEIGQCADSEIVHYIEKILKANEININKNT